MQQDNQIDHKDENVRFVKRRSLLKALAAAGGAVTAASLLPGKWASPVVGLGVLPAHAQMSAGDHRIQRCDASDTDDYFFDVSCLITPPDPNISMTLQVFEGANLLVTLRATSDGTGQALVNTDAFTLGWTFADPLRFVWSFTSMTDGLGTCESTILPRNGHP